MISLITKLITKEVNLFVLGVEYMKLRNKIFIITLLLSLTLLAWFDVTSSNQAGLKNADRGMAHVFIALSVIIHALYLFFHRVPTSRGNTINRSLLFIFLWFCFVDFVHFVSGISLSFSSVGAMLLLSAWWFLTYNFTYSYLSNNRGNLKPLLFVYISMFVIWVGLNLYARAQIITNFDRGNAVTGYAYYLLIFIPYLFLIEHKKLKILLIALSAIMVLTSFKRGTMVTLPIMLFTYGFIHTLQRGGVIKFINRSLLVGAVALVALLYIDEASDGFLSSRFTREELASGSGRTEYRDIALRVVGERGFIDFFVGSGHGSSVNLIGTGIHNEWLEFLFSFGVIGLLLYTFLGLKFLRQGYRYYRLKSRYVSHMMMMMAYFYMVSFFSGFIGVYVTYYFFAFMGIITYLNEREIALTDKVRQIR